MYNVATQAAKFEFVDKDEQIKGQFIDGCGDKRFEIKRLKFGYVKYWCSSVVVALIQVDGLQQLATRIKFVCFKYVWFG